MSKLPLCNFKIVGFSQEDAAELISSIKLSGLELQETTDRTGIEEVALIITILAGTSQLAEQSIKLKKAIANWKKKRKETNLEQEALLEHPEGESLNFLTATDEEVEQWVEERVKWLSQLGK